MGLATDAKIHGVIIQIRDLVGDRISTSDAVLHGHGKDEGWQPVKAPDAVVFANSTEEIAAIVNICRATGTPIIPYGAGTSIEGQVHAAQGGISVDVYNIRLQNKKCVFFFSWQIKECFGELKC